MTHALNYSFQFHYERDITFSINIPFDRLEGVEITIEGIRNLIDNDDGLLLAMLGHEELRLYEQMLMGGDIYLKDLERNKETLRIVNLDSDAL